MARSRVAVVVAAALVAVVAVALVHSHANRAASTGAVSQARNELASGTSAAPTSAPRYEGPLAWSADGQRVAVVRKAAGGLSALVLQVSDVAPKVVRSQALVDAQGLGRDWSLNGMGERLYYTVGLPRLPRIRVMSMSSGKVHDVVQGLWPVASPRGDDLAYAAGGGTSVGFPLYVLPGRGPARRLSSTVEATLFTTWSPDGRRIAYVGHRYTGPEWSAQTAVMGPRALAVATLDGSGAKEEIVPTDPQGELAAVAWANDTTVAYAEIGRTADGHPTCGVYSYDLRTQTSREILPFGHVQFEPGQVWLSRGARRLLAQTGPDRNSAYCSGFETVDLRTGRSAPLHFRERVLAAPSPDGTRLLATGQRTGRLYLARLSASESRWDIGAVDVK